MFKWEACPVLWLNTTLNLPTIVIFFVFLKKEMGSHCDAQGGHQLLSSSDPPTSAPWGAGTAVCTHASRAFPNKCQTWPCILTPCILPISLQTTQEPLNVQGPQLHIFDSSSALPAVGTQMVTK